MGAQYNEGYMAPPAIIEQDEATALADSLSHPKNRQWSATSLVESLADTSLNEQAASISLGAGSGGGDESDFFTTDSIHVFNGGSNIVSEYNFSRDNLPNVTQLDGRPTQYSMGEIAIMLLVLVAWSYAVYALWQSWAWNLRPPKDPWRRKKLPPKQRLLKQVSTVSSNKNNSDNGNGNGKTQIVVDLTKTISPKALLSCTRTQSVTASPGGAKMDAPSSSSRDIEPAIVEQVIEGPHAKTAADLFDEMEGPATPRPRGLSKVLVITDEDETVLFEKPGRRLKDAIALKELRAGKDKNRLLWPGRTAVERSKSTSLVSTESAKKGDVEKSLSGDLLRTTASPSSESSNRLKGSAKRHSSITCDVIPESNNHKDDDLKN